jgi:hypothetical protein
MPRINLTMQPELYDYILKHKPKALSLPAFCSLLIEQSWLGLDSASKLPAYRVGAGNTGHRTTETGSQPQPEQSSAEGHLSPPEKVFSPDLPPIGMGDGVGRESEGTPRKDPKQIPGNLLAHDDLIRDFWRIKGGSKGDRAWSLLLTELTKIQELHGDAVLRQQIELAINGKWKGITLANLERFTPARPTQQLSASGAPMTHMEQTVASFIRKQRAMEEGRAVA